MKSYFDLQNLIQGFKLSCQTENKSPRTIEWYTCFLERFHQFSNRNGYPTNVKRINKDQLRAFIIFLQQEIKTPHTGKSSSEATIQGYVRTLKAFFSWLMREEYIEQNPMSKIPVPRAQVKIVDTFSHEQVTKLIGCATLQTIRDIVTWLSYYYCLTPASGFPRLRLPFSFSLPLFIIPPTTKPDLTEDNSLFTTATAPSAHQPRLSKRPYSNVLTLSMGGL